MAKITLIGLFNFDPTIFNKINLEVICEGVETAEEEKAEETAEV